MLAAVVPDSDSLTGPVEMGPSSQADNRRSMTAVNKRGVDMGPPLVVLFMDFERLGFS
jgi:hypothetical protein